MYTYLYTFTRAEAQKTSMLTFGIQRDRCATTASAVWQSPVLDLGRHRGQQATLEAMPLGYRQT